MNQGLLIGISIIFPIIMGLLIFFCKSLQKEKSVRRVVGITLVLETALVIATVLLPHMAIKLGAMTADFPVIFSVDRMGAFFAVLMCLVWCASGFFSFTYMRHEEREHRYFGFYLLTLGVLIGMDFAGNFVTYYLFFEWMTLCSLPLVLHSQTKEAIAAGKKYLYYSMFGALCALIGIFAFMPYEPTAEGLFFTPGGCLDLTFTGSDRTFLLIAAGLMISGFGVKAGMFPMHGWLPTAHPQAPAPASAVLSGMITKAGVLGVIRAVFYVVGAEYLAGTWVQYAWMVLALVTIFMGSMMAYREKVLKKRLAYSTVSQISYILFGLSLMTAQGMAGAMLHIAGHAVVKNALFLTAGAIIYYTGRTKADEMAGVGRQLPVIMGAYTLASLALIGIPPTAGFVSKWYLAAGALDFGGALGIAGIAVILISAVLTAGYLLPLSIYGFAGGEGKRNVRASLYMVVPVVILAMAALVIGLCGFPLAEKLIAFGETLQG